MAPNEMPAAEQQNGTLAPTEQAVEFSLKICAYLIFALLTAFVTIIALWSYHPPQLPGDTAGVIVGGFIGWIGGLLSNWRAPSRRQ